MSSDPSVRREITLGEIAGWVGGELIGDPKIRIAGACGIEEAREDEITFLAHPKYQPQLAKSRARAVVLGPNGDPSGKAGVRVNEPNKAFLKILSYWLPEDPLTWKGIHASAVVSPSAQIGKDVFVGPGAVIGDDCRVGDGSSILANAVLGRAVVLGSQCLIYENVTLRDGTQLGNRVTIHAGAVLGSDGFGYEWIDGKHVKVPQTGIVAIEDEVEIGANVCIDRARFGRTLIKKGTKIDNLVQIAHNVEVGENCLIVSQVGIAGSAHLGDRVILAGQVGVVPHVTVGDDAKIGAQSGVFTSVPADSILLGSPPRPVRESKELIIYTSRLPQLFKDLKEIKNKLGLK